MIDENVQAILAELGITRYGVMPVSEVVFSEAFRAACESNQCGKHGTNWSCPPGVGEPAALIERAREFQSGLVIQTVWPIEDIFDMDGMLAGGVKHNALFRVAMERLIPLLEGQPALALSAGACSVCDACTYPSGQPCRQPERAMASLESYGIDVARLIESAGLKYHNGANTVSYVGLLLYGTSAAQGA
jgi:predicted metal-binding protein